jgi:hypothetical protein
VTVPGNEVQGKVDALLRAQVDGLSAEEVTYLLAVFANRAASELHRVSRQEATQRKGSEEWGSWAALQNASRNVILGSSTCRDLAARLTGRPR